MRALLATLIICSSGMFLALPASAQQGDLGKYCPADIKRLCQNVQPGGGRIMKCLKQHAKEVSVGCAQALQKMKQ